MELSVSYRRWSTRPSTYQGFFVEFLFRRWLDFYLAQRFAHLIARFYPSDWWAVTTGAYFSVLSYLAKIRKKSTKFLWQQGRYSYQKVASYNKQDIPILEARSIEEIYDDLVERVLSTTKMVNLFDKKYIIGLAGPPGAGKSTLAGEVVQRLNIISFNKDAATDSAVQNDSMAAVLPMDGFHLYRSQLDAMEDPEEAHARRGAPWTFNPDLLLKCLCSLRSQGSVYAPSFDHGVGDPVENDIYICPLHKIVIVEGNYLFIEEGAWKDVSAIFDEKWFIDIDLDSSMERVLKRHISTGKNPDVAKWRVDYNDRPNAELIIESKHNADLIIKSVDFQS